MAGKKTSRKSARRKRGATKKKTARRKATARKTAKKKSMQKSKTPPNGTTVRITIDANGNEDSDPTVSAGDTVVWNNTGAVTIYVHFKKKWPFDPPKAAIPVPANGSSTGNVVSDKAGKRKHYPYYTSTIKKADIKKAQQGPPNPPDIVVN
jgi:plastocyanin